MANHRYASDTELLARLKANRSWQEKLLTDIADHEQRLSKLRSDLGNAEEQARWLVSYLAQPETPIRPTTYLNVGFTGRFPDFMRPGEER